MPRNFNWKETRLGYIAFVRKLAAVMGLLWLASISTGAQAQTKPSRTDAGAEPVRSVLWVGNSFFYYNNSLHGHYNELTASADAASRTRGTSVTVSGSGLDWHDVATYLQPGGIGKYSFVPGNKIVFNPPGRQFDTVIMMDCSQCPIHPQLQGAFHATVKKDAEIVSKYGARPALFMSWAYKDAPDMTTQLAEQYTIAGNANNALVIPAGLAFAKSVSRRPNLELYQPDLRHPTLAGTYLAACTSYATLQKKSPVGIKYTAGLDPEVATFLQQVAADTVRDYFGRQD